MKLDEISVSEIPGITLVFLKIKKQFQVSNKIASVTEIVPYSSFSHICIVSPIINIAHQNGAYYQSWTNIDTSKSSKVSSH